MMNNNQLYKINLEDYSFPRFASVVKPYYGSMEDIIHLMVLLSGNDWIRTRYKETIDAVECYDLDNEITHTMAGQVFPVLTPVQEVCRFETQLTDQHWDYKSVGGAVYPCSASRVHVCQTLISTEEGYERCLKVKLFGLRVCNHVIGWTAQGRLIKGFPGVVTWDGESHTLNMYVSQCHYESDELEVATADMADMSRIDLAVVMADILAEG